MLFLDSAFPSKERKDKALGSMLVLVLALFKCLRVVSMYVTTDLLLVKGMKVAPLLFWLLAISATTSGFLSKPWSKPLAQIHVCI